MTQAYVQRRSWPFIQLHLRRLLEIFARFSLPQLIKRKLDALASISKHDKFKEMRSFLMLLIKSELIHPAMFSKFLAQKKKTFDHLV